MPLHQGKCKNWPLLCAVKILDFITSLTNLWSLIPNMNSEFEKNELCEKHKVSAFSLEGKKGAIEGKM